jgi:hypothetical protein
MKTGLQNPGLGTWAMGRRQRGAASLVIVLMLFFVVSLVAAYTSRNLIFEQRTSVNQYRSSMAFETADAGLEWVVAMLNGGRIGDDCTEASATPTSSTFRQRYLDIDPRNGTVLPRTRAWSWPNPRPPLPTSPDEYPNSDLWPTCVWTGTQWRCSCPSSSDPSLATIPGGGLHPAFRLRFFTNRDIVTPDGKVAIPNGRPGVIGVEINGCIKLADPNPLMDPCLNDFSENPVESEGRSQHVALIALKSALTTPPAAAITVWGSVPGGGALVARNTSTDSGGITLHTAGAVPDTSTFELAGTPGTPGARTITAGDLSLVPDGLTLADLTTAPVDSKRDRVFASVFGLLPDSFRTQPAAVPFTCAGLDCRQALAARVAENPNRVIWVTGDLRLGSAGNIGSLPNPTIPAEPGPASIVVNGDVIVDDPDVHIFGVIYVRGMVTPLGNNAWQGPGRVTGALLSETGLSSSASPTVDYNHTVIESVRRNHGSFVRLPGDWRDYKAYRP